LIRSSHLDRLRCFIRGHGPDYGVYDISIESASVAWTELRCENCGFVLATDWSYDRGEA